MSFKEFVIAIGRKDLIEILGNWPTDREVPDVYAVPMKKMLKDYYIVGGMPEAQNSLSYPSIGMTDP